jgi:hypothetical protein
MDGQKALVILQGDALLQHTSFVETLKLKVRIALLFEECVPLTDTTRRKSLQVFSGLHFCIYALSLSSTSWVDTQTCRKNTSTIIANNTATLQNVSMSYICR